MSAVPEQGRTPTRSAKWQRAYPDELLAAETERLWLRRGAKKGMTDTERPSDAAGLALSGGGMRSATFALGFLQGLARRELLGKVDYLSTVSGGSYTGAAYSSLFTRSNTETHQGISVADVERILPDAGTRHPGDPSPGSWLRKNGRYLAPNGGDLTLALSIWMRNGLSLHLVMGLTLILGWLLLQLPWVLATQWGGVPDAWLPLSTAVSAYLKSTLFASPWLDMALLPLGFALAHAWAFWLVKTQSDSERSPMWGVIVFALFAGLQLFCLHWLPGPAGQALLGVGMLGLVAATLQALALNQCAKQGGTRAVTDAATRNLLSRRMAACLSLMALLLVIALLDTLARSWYAAFFNYKLNASQSFSLGALWTGPAALYALLVPVLARLKGVMDWLKEKGFGGQASWTLEKLAPVAAAVLALIWFTATGLVAQAVLHDLDSPMTSAGGFNNLPAASQYWPVLGLVLLFTVLFGQTLSFLNRSSYQSLYAARLTRAFLGASNPQRAKSGAPPVTDPLPDDDVRLVDHCADSVQRRGGPLHLVNVTINESASARERTVNRDRRGIGMAVGPCGLSAGIKHHAAFETVAGGSGMAYRPLLRAGESFSMFGLPPKTASGKPRPPPALRQDFEALSLANWTAISGAAVAPGLGLYGSLSRAFLVAFANIRLGYWWHAGTDSYQSGEVSGWRAALPRLAQLLPVQYYLIHEFMGRFYGADDQRWYLSDGGHFENLGVYELLRRRLPFMVAVDVGTDRRAGSDSLFNLIRKARVDFHAEIAFLDEAGLNMRFPGDRPIGTLDDLVQAKNQDQPDQIASKRAALARVRYLDDGSECWLLYIKAVRTGDEPPDLLDYWEQSKSHFPYESTGDQFYDEAQWESYRKLGEWTAETLFAQGGPFASFGMPLAAPQPPAA